MAVANVKALSITFSGFDTCELHKATILAWWQSNINDEHQLSQMDPHDELLHLHCAVHRRNTKCNKRAKFGISYKRKPITKFLSQIWCLRNVQILDFLNNSSQKSTDLNTFWWQSFDEISHSFTYSDSACPSRPHAKWHLSTLLNAEHMILIAAALLP